LSEDAKMSRATAASVVEPIIRAYREDFRALFLAGPRGALDDLTAGSGGVLRTLADELRRELATQLGLVLVEYSLSGGLCVDSSHLEARADRETLESEMRRLGITGQPSNVQRHEPSRILRALGTGLRATPAAAWADGRPMRLAVLLRCFEHLAPAGPAPGSQTDEQLVAIELVSELGRSLALRQSGHLLLVQGREDFVDELVRRSLLELRLPMPDAAEKRAFVAAAAALYDRASFEPGLTAEGVARLTERLPNRGLEGLMRASHRHGRPLRVAELVEQKASDVLQISEGTLRLLYTERVKGVRLCGRAIGHAQRVLETFGDALLARNAAAPANVLLVGAPGTGKTDLAVEIARRSRVPAFEIVSPKHSLVGETERRASLQMRILRESGGIGFVDEITEAFPTERSDFDGDSGASRAVLAAQLTWLSDESRRGEVLVVATTNVPWRIGKAMAERFTVVPVLMPLLEDLPAIVVSVARRVDPTCEVEERDPEIGEAAVLFHRKGASPRHIRQALSQARLVADRLTPERIRTAAEDLLLVEDRSSSLLAELCAIRACSLRSFLPWAGAPSSYPYPEHLEELVDRSTGDVDREALERRIHELAPYGNV